MKMEQMKMRKRGFVIVVVLCLMVLMTALLVGFSNNSRAELRKTDYWLKSVQALNFARGGLNAAIAAIRDCNDIYRNKELEELFSGKYRLDVAGGGCQVLVDDESGKININYLLDRDGRPDRLRIDQLLRLIDLVNGDETGASRISYNIVPAIIDWIDSDDQVTTLAFIKWANLGAEAGYYKNRDLPYQCKNAPLATLEELLLVKDVTPVAFEKIRAYITVYGDGKININCAPQRVIESLSEQVDPALARVIIDRRELRPFETIGEMRDLPGMTEDIYRIIKRSATVRASQHYFQVISRGYVDDVSYKVTAIVKKDFENKAVDVIWYKEG